MAAKPTETPWSLAFGPDGRLRDIIQGPDGYLYVATSNRDGRGKPGADDDRVIRLAPRPIHGAGEDASAGRF